MSLYVEQAFQILEVPPAATWEEVRQAYRELVKVWHPDRFQEDEKFKCRATRKVQDINAAYRILEQHFGSPGTPSPLDDQKFEQPVATQQTRAKPEGQPFPNFTTLEDLEPVMNFWEEKYVQGKYILGISLEWRRNATDIRVM